MTQKLVSKILLGAAATLLATTAFAGSHQDDFIHFIAPKAEAANKDVAKQREKLLKLNDNRSHLSSSDKAWVTKLAKDYGIKNPDLSKDSTWTDLTKRVDIVPTSLVVAQAANESAWGNSRFAKQGNNYFGQWCYKAGCGIVPKQRSSGSHHEVKRFASAQASVTGYIHNLNSNGAYKQLRDIRAQERAAHKQPNGKAMAAGLNHYSELGQRYVSMIQTMITKYNLGQYDTTVV